MNNVERIDLDSIISLLKPVDFVLFVENRSHF